MNKIEVKFEQKHYFNKSWFSLKSKGCIGSSKMFFLDVLMVRET